MTVMMAEDRAAIVAWKLFCGNASIEWFQGELERQTTPAWNRAARLIADAIRDAQIEARAYADSIIEGWRGNEYSLEADLAKEADAEQCVLPDETPLGEYIDGQGELPAEMEFELGERHYPEPSSALEVFEAAEVAEWQR